MIMFADGNAAHVRRPGEVRAVVAGSCD